MKEIKVVDSDATLFSSNDCDDPNCPVCLLVKKCERENRLPTAGEIENALLSID